MKPTTTLFAKSRYVLFAIALLLGSNNLYAETIYEDFENVTIVDADGNELTSSWTSGAGLSNGWKVIGGTLYSNDNGDYQLVHAVGKGYLMTDYYLSSSSTSNNSAYIFIPVKLCGDVKFFLQSNLDDRSKKTSYAKVYEATADGTVTGNVLFSASPEKGVKWGKQYGFTINDAEGKYIALNLVYTDLDDFTATTADGSAIEPTLSVSATSLDFGTVTSETVKTFTVKSNVTTEAAFEITGDDAGIFSLEECPHTLIAGMTTTIAVKMKATEAGLYTAKLTVTAGELSKEVALSGTWEVNVIEPDVPTDWTGEDFNAYHEDDPMPAGWTVEGGWHIGEPFMLDTPAVVITDTSEGGTLITPFFNAKSNQALHFYFSKTAVGWMYYSSKMEISYSTDKTNWTVVATYNKYEADGVKTIDLPAAGSYYVRFVTNDRTYLDDFLLVNIPSTGIDVVHRSSTSEAAESSELSTMHSSVYDLQGRRVTNSQTHGILIYKGKKVKR